MTLPLLDIAEAAGMILVAYLLGCSLAYGLRRLLHAARGTRRMPAQPVSARRPRAG